MNKNVSIVIPVYNAEKSIKRCLDSVLHQTYSDIEIIIVDDGSSDSSPIICDSYAERDPRISVFHRTNVGVSASRNFGIEKSNGDYICFLDSDDVIKPNLIEDNYNFAKEKNVDVLIYGFTYCSEDTGERTENVVEDFCGPNKEFFEGHFCEIVSSELLNAPWNKMIKKSYLVKNNILFDLRYSICEDIVFSLMLFKNADIIAINSKSYYDYYLQTENSLRTKLHNNFLEASKEVYKHGMEYCDQYSENSSQKDVLCLLFSNMIIHYIKRVVRSGNITGDDKDALLARICDDPDVRTALQRSRFAKTLTNKIKKRIVKRTILARDINKLKFIYRVLIRYD